MQICNTIKIQEVLKISVVFLQIPETSKLPLPIVPRRPHPRVNLTQKDLGERVLVFNEKRGILRYIGKL